MRISYLLLSSTWGMHQYTADLANRQLAAGTDLHLVTTQHVPRDRYNPVVSVYTPVATTDRGFSLQGLRIRSLRSVRHTIRNLDPDLVHITGPHLWNPLLLNSLHQAGVPTVHTLHDMHPHAGAVYGRLLYLWNGWVLSAADHILVHGNRYRRKLLSWGVSPSRVTCTPLTHLFTSHYHQEALVQSQPLIQHEPWALLMGRLEVYKGLDVLVEACRLISAGGDQSITAVIAGPGQLEKPVSGLLPANIEVRNRLVEDEEAIDLFSRCGLVVLPYIEASQSALVAAAYFFRKPVIVTRVGALPEYVVDGETGWVIPANDPEALAEAIRTALSDPARLAGMGEAGRAWYEQQREAELATLQSMYGRVAGIRH